MKPNLPTRRLCAVRINFRLRYAWIIGLLGCSLLPHSSARGTDTVEATRLAREFIEADDDDSRNSILAQLADFTEDYRPILAEIQKTKFEPVEAGYHPEEHFTTPKLRKKHPKDLLYYSIPKTYRPDRPTGLIIFMHGGGKNTSRDAPRYTLDYPENDDDPEENSQLGDVFNATGMIAVGPSAPKDTPTYYRWCTEDCDEYLSDVIEECSLRFHLDPDRIVLLGHSMGGFGAYHHIQRQPDRFACVVANAGSWTLAHWPVIRGTPLGIVHGVRDAVKGERWHYTDIDYARWTDRILKEKGLDYTYYEHDGEHGIQPSRELLQKYLMQAADLRRDPYAKHVVLASPLGFDDYYCYPVEHNRWLTLDKETGGEIEYDELYSNHADDFDDWRLRHRVGNFDGSSIEAKIKENNTIEITTQNVSRFTIWLHPQMIDIARPVSIVVDGKLRFSTRVAPSLADALESYHRRRDWGLIYPIKIKLEN